MNVVDRISNFIGVGMPNKQICLRICVGALRVFSLSQLEFVSASILFERWSPARGRPTFSPCGRRCPREARADEGSSTA
jgi:hypothetical protein